MNTVRHAIVLPTKWRKEIDDSGQERVSVDPTIAGGFQLRRIARVPILAGDTPVMPSVVSVQFADVNQYGRYRLDRFDGADGTLILGLISVNEWLSPLSDSSGLPEISDWEKLAQDLLDETDLRAWLKDSDRYVGWERSVTWYQ